MNFLPPELAADDPSSDINNDTPIASDDTEADPYPCARID
jgi:hypothetical protein